MMLEYFINMLIYAIGGYGYELFVEAMEDIVEFYKEFVLRLKLHHNIHIH